jgi:hypothetical protein
MATRRSVTKPNGWKGKKDDRYWHKETAFAVRSMCTSCGLDALGWATDDSRRYHLDNCPRIAGLRAEWKGDVDATGKARVHRLDIPTKGAHLTREDALRALDADLVAQADTISRQRADVAKMLKEKESAQ